MPKAAKEGDLYATVCVGGKEFVIYYGYYDPLDRQSGEPIPVYPDLKANPVYSAQGCPLVTQMQIACSHYQGPAGEDSCGHCPFFQKAERLFGLCTSPKKTKTISKNK